MEPSTPPEKTPPTNLEPATNPMPPTEPVVPAEQPVTQAAPEATPAPADGKLPSAFSLFKPSWEAVKLNFTTFLLLTLVPALLFIVPAIAQFGTHYGANSAGLSLNSGISAGMNIITLILGLVGLIVVLLLVGPALVYTQLQSVNGQKVGLKESLVKGWHFAFRFLGLAIVVGLIIVVGFVLLIVPGLFMLRRYILAPFFLVANDCSISEAMNQSSTVSKKYSSALWGLIGVTFLISLPGIIPVIGGIVSAILSIAYYCAPAIRYKEVTTGIPSVATK